LRREERCNTLPEQPGQALPCTLSALCTACCCAGDKTPAAAVSCPSPSHGPNTQSIGGAHLISPISTGMLSWKGASRKCTSMSCAPCRNSSIFCGTTAVRRYNRG
jgi:hypothetical protein